LVLIAIYSIFEDQTNDDDDDDTSVCFVGNNLNSNTVHCVKKKKQHKRNRHTAKTKVDTTNLVDRETTQPTTVQLEGTTRNCLLCTDINDVGCYTGTSVSL